MFCFQLTGLKLGPEKYHEKRELQGESDTWTTVSLTSSLHTSHSTPAQNKKGRQISPPDLSWGTVFLSDIFHAIRAKKCGMYR